MTVDKHDGGSGILGRPAGENRGQPAAAFAACLPDLCHREAGGAQLRDEPLRGPPHVGLMGRVARDRRDLQPLLEAGEERWRVLLDVVADVHDPLLAGWGSRSAAAAGCAVAGPTVAGPPWAGPPGRAPGPPRGGATHTRP